MAVAALIVSIVAALGAVGAVWYARVSGRAAVESVAIETSRRHEELTPRLRVTVDESADAIRVHEQWMSVFLAGPTELGRLDGLSVVIRDDPRWRAGKFAGGRPPEQGDAGILGPYGFVPDSGPGGGVDRVAAGGAVRVGESLVFSMAATSRPSWFGGDTFQWRKVQGFVVLLRFECYRAGLSWSLLAEVDVLSTPVTFEVP